MWVTTLWCGAIAKTSQSFVGRIVGQSQSLKFDSKKTLSNFWKDPLSNQSDQALVYEGSIRCSYHPASVDGLIPAQSTSAHDGSGSFGSAKPRSLSTDTILASGFGSCSLIGRLAKTAILENRYSFSVFSNSWRLKIGSSQVHYCCRWPRLLSIFCG
jgi:hypothetical protein